MWSQRMAEKIASILGLAEADKQARTLGLPRVAVLPVVQGIVRELADALRYLPAEQVRWTFNLAHALSDSEVGQRNGGASRETPEDKLRQVRDYAYFLKARHGFAQPTDESDEWSREDELEWTRDSMRRLEEIDPWPEDKPNVGDSKDAEAR
jgi:hypothetical protein